MFNLTTGPNFGVHFTTRLFHWHLACYGWRVGFSVAESRANGAVGLPNLAAGHLVHGTAG